MSNIRAVMEEEAARTGVISFARFMELALYCPNSGYYARMDTSPGQKGDYFTSVSTGSLFGELLAFQFSEWLDQIPAPRPQIVEAGAHDAQLASDILLWFQQNRPDLANTIKYHIIEPLPNRRFSQQNTLAKLEVRESVTWFDSWDTMSVPVQGIIFSNELLDAMPVHRLGWDAAQKKWFEWGVALRGADFVWTRMSDFHASPLINAHLDLPNELLDVLPDGFTTEVSPTAVDWWFAAARKLHSGKMLAFDYGLTAEEFFLPQRKSGTLRAYYRHHASDDLLARPGEQDLTAHVNFSAIRLAGESAGLRTEQFVTQSQFLTAIVQERCRKNAAFGKKIAAQSRQFQTLTHPEHLGQSFRVIVQTR